MAELLTVAEYPAIRAMIDVTLTARALPDSVIGLTSYAGEAVAWVLAEQPEATTYAVGTDEHTAVQRAAIYACAALLVPAIPIITSEAYGNAFRYTREKYDPAVLAASLWEKAREAVSKTKEDEISTATGPSRFFFGTLKGRRGR